MWGGQLRLISADFLLATHLMAMEIEMNVCLDAATAWKVFQAVAQDVGPPHFD